MSYRKPAAQIIFNDEREYRDFMERARLNGRSASNELRALLGLPELKHGGARRAAARKRNASYGAGLDYYPENRL